MAQHPIADCRLPTAGFTEVSNQLADKGFLVTTTDDLINWALSLIHI